jgi:hypothetical protein
MSVRAKRASQGHQPAPEAKPGASEKLYMENTLLRVAGALFCHDRRGSRTRTAPIEVNKGVSDKRITIRLDPEYGQPGPLAHKVFVALMRKHSGYGRPVQREISFRKRELMRLIGREWSGGNASRQLMRALLEIHYTFVKASFQSERTNLWTEHSFNIFPEVTISRRAENSPDIEACVVAIAEPILASLRDSHFTCLNYTLISQLGTIGQALYMRLFFHFANLYEEVGKSRLSVTKRYDDICREWLGGLTVLRYRSTIEREQLGPHLRQLCQVGFLSSYTIESTSGADGLKITFRPGPVFLSDYDRYYRRRNQSEIQFEYEEERRDLQEPLQAVRLFIEKSTGKTPSPFTSVSEKDVETARQIIARVGFVDFGAFVDYALTEARKTKFPVKFLGGLKQYVDSHLDYRVSAAAARDAEAARRAEANQAEERDAYERHHRKAAEQLFAGLSAADQEALRREAKKLAGKGPLSSRFAEVKLITLVTQRYADSLPTFADWRRSQGRDL